jgi:GNAT superfamily N-acetyltransferase
MTLKEQSFRGAQITEVLEPLAALRIQVFRDYPYLYEGSLDYELKYLNTYAQAGGAFLFSVFDDGQMIGATTAIPLREETEEVQAPFIQQGIPLEQVFYFGESILLSKYRGLGIGHRFFEAREKHALSFEHIRYTSFCAVQRPADHPLRPGDYQPLDGFWQKRGYTIQPQLQSYFTWKDVDEAAESPKRMTYWWKEWPQN